MKTRSLVNEYTDIKDAMGPQGFAEPCEVEKVFKVRYDSSLLRQLVFRCPLQKVIEFCKARGEGEFVILPPPPVPLSVLDMLAWKKPGECSGDNTWVERAPGVVSQKTTEGRWLIMRKTHIPGSLLKSWGEQIKLLYLYTRVPNIADLVWGMQVCYRVFGIKLFGNGESEEVGISVRSSTHLIHKGGLHHVRAFFGKSGIEVQGWREDGPSIRVGLPEMLDFRHF